MAIDGAERGGWLGDQGLVHGLAARFFRDRGEARFADEHARAAQAAYSRWGAHALAAQFC